MRGDLYNGLAVTRQAEPRVGRCIHHQADQHGSACLVCAHTGNTLQRKPCALQPGLRNEVLSPLLACTPGVSSTLQPGFRNEFHAGLQQAFGKNLVVSGDYIWKYTHNAFDFSILGNTPIFFPIDWHNSKIPGFALRADVPNFHHFSAFVVMSSVAARFFPPQSAGAGATVGQSGFRSASTTTRSSTRRHTCSTRSLAGVAPGLASTGATTAGLVAGSTPCYNVTGANTLCAATSTTLNGQPAIDLSGLTADQEFQAGFTCDGVKATPTTPLPTPCLASQFTSTLLSIPAPDTEDDDQNPPRVAPRSLFDASVGDDNLFGGDKTQMEPSPHRGELRQQVRALQLPLDLQRDALCHAASAYGGTRFSLLGTPPFSNATGTAFNRCPACGVSRRRT